MSLDKERLNYIAPSAKKFIIAGLIFDVCTVALQSNFCDIILPRKVFNFLFVSLSIC